MNIKCSNTPGVFTISDDSGEIATLQGVVGKGREVTRLIRRMADDCIPPADRRIEAASNWLQTFEEFWAESEEAEHTDVGRANELLQSAAVVLQNELKGWVS